MKRDMELLILGLLKKMGPSHGYVIKREIEEKINPLVNIHLTSIYYTMERLAKKGFLTVKEANGERGKSRKVYSITEKGKIRFETLLMKNILQVQRPYFNIDLALIFLDDIPSGKRAERLIKKRITNLNKVKSWIEENLAHNHTSPHKEIILKHLKKELEEEITFTKELLELVRDGKIAGKDLSGVHDAVRVNSPL